MKNIAFYSSAGIMIPVALSLTACVSPLKKSERLNLCNADCHEVNPVAGDASLYHDLHDFLKSHEGRTVSICDTKGDGLECKREGILVYYQGAQLPGPARVKTIKIKKVFYDEKARTIQFVTEFGRKSFLGIPFFCSDVDSSIALNQETDLTLKTEGGGAICNWMGVGVFWLNLYVSIDRIDTRRRFVTGNYRLTGAGPLNGGGGTGHILMSFAAEEEADPTGDPQKTAHRQDI